MEVLRFRVDGKDSMQTQALSFDILRRAQLCHLLWQCHMAVPSSHTESVVVAHLFCQGCAVLGGRLP
jgi:hypothetical protein